MKFATGLGLALLLAALCAAAPAHARSPILGIGEQHHTVFADKRIHDLGIRHVRYVVGWDALKSGWQRGEMDAYFGEALRTGVDVMVSFSKSRTRDDRYLPTRKQYTRQFRRFRERYPWVKTFIPWNEANHCSQPLCHKPRVAARYFDVLRSECSWCTVLAADLLDHGDLFAWVRAFKRHATHKTRLWGLHNYVDANRFRKSGTRAMLRATRRGKIWFTETGGIVYRSNPTKIPMNESVPHAADATRWVFKLARLSPRIKRIYFYHWMPSPEGDPKRAWDSALTDRRGRARPALEVIQRWVQARAAEAARRALRKTSG